MTQLQYLRESFVKFVYPENIGRWAISWEFWLAIAPFRLIILDQRFLGNHDSYWTKLFPILVVGYLSSGFPLLIASKTFLRHRESVKPALLQLVATWLASDIFLSVCLNLLLGSENVRTTRLEQPMFILIHAVASIPLGASILLAWCVLFLSRDRSVLLRQSLVTQRSLLENLDEYYGVVRARLGQQVSESLLPGFARIKQEVSTLTKAKVLKGKYSDFAERVRNFSLSEVRALSHLIATEPGESFERRDLDPTQIIDTTRLDGSVLTPASPFLASFFYLLIRAVVSPEAPVWLLIFETLVLACSTDVAFKLYRVFSDRSLRFRTPLLLFSLAGPVACVAATHVGLTENSDASSVSVFALCVVLSAAAVAYPYRYYTELEVRLAKAQESIAQTQNNLRSASESVRESFSRIIHGKIQGRLALVSFLLGQLASGEVKARDKASHLGKLQELLNRIDDELRKLVQPSDLASLKDTVAELASDWAGLLNIEFEIKTGVKAMLRAHPQVENAIAQVAEEAVLNARIHGNAGQVIIWVRKLDSSRIHLVVADNGVGESIDSKPGLGKSMYAIAADSWILERSEAGPTILSAVFGVDKR
jgi:signal transduction histidine kinase